ncbi:hypothetical protein [Candidatus Viadribacter manganicus]|uniref:hypothetical protein n=1 Tax=Candidatus Viadribacter manganicus TaxID=1759059 RepID=UPI001D179D11|nr:hypothetical protein [Candidatus Viadribacter manganicus]
MRLPLRERARRERVRKEAWRMAVVGDHTGWRAIEASLSPRNGNSAHEALRIPFMRIALNLTCALSHHRTP